MKIIKNKKTQNVQINRNNYYYSIFDNSIVTLHANRRTVYQCIFCMELKNLN